MSPEVKSDEYVLSATNSKNEVIDVVICKCQHCDEMVPKVGTCPDCNTVYEHKNTVENPETGYLHFIYECSGCPPGNRKAQKIIKINEGGGSSKSDDLIKSFF